MKIPTKILNITVVALIGLIFLAFALHGSTASIGFGNDLARDLVSKNIVADRSKTINGLEDLVKQNVNNSSKNQEVRICMVLLGKLRADDAAPLLASHLSYLVLDDRRKAVASLPMPENYYPAVDALIHIGIPSLDALLYQAANTDDRKNDKLTNYVFISVLGTQPAIAFINDAIDNQHEEQQKQRLRVLLVALRKLPTQKRTASVKLFL